MREEKIICSVLKLPVNRCSIRFQFYPSERRDILNCTGYVLAEGLSAAENIPPFDNSAMDGYAVRAADVQNASEDESCGSHNR